MKRPEIEKRKVKIKVKVLTPLHLARVQRKNLMFPAMRSIRMKEIL